MKIMQTSTDRNLTPPLRRRALVPWLLVLALGFLAFWPSQQANALGLPNPIANFTVLEDSPVRTFDLSLVFSDATDYSVFLNDNPALVDASISGSILTLDFQENQSGSAAIIVSATDGMNTLDNGFRVTVVPVNDFPFTTPSLLPNLTTPMNTPVTATFEVNDVEDDAAGLPLGVSRSFHNLDPAAPVIDGAGLVLIRSGPNDSECSLTLTPLPGATGEAIISITVGDNGFPPLVATRSFRLTVTPDTSPNNPPVAVINVSPDADIDDGDPEIILISVNGVDAPATLDGTMSSDPDGDPLTSYSWFANSGSGPVLIGEGATLTTRLGIGEHQIFLSVSDGSLDSPFAVRQVLVIPVSEAIGLLIARVESSSVRPDWKRILITELRATSDLFAGRPPVRRLSPCEAGVAGLRFFRSSVIFLSQGRINIIPRALATEWIYLTDQIINNVTCE